MQIRPTDSFRKRTYLLVMPGGVVMQDMTETLIEHDPAGQVLSTSDPVAAVALLAGQPALVVAFVASHPDAFEASDLKTAIARCGGRAVLMGNAAEQVGTNPGWSVLCQPFFHGLFVIGFPVLLAGVVLFMILDHVPDARPREEEETDG